MLRFARRMVVTAALPACVVACNTEPERVAGGDPVQIVADPAVVLVPQFGTQELLVRLVDRQGQSLESEVSISAPGTGIEITADPLFRPVYGPDGALTVNTANTEARLEIEGLALGSTTFTVAGGGLTRDVTVTVIPADVDAAYTPVLPDAADTVTVALPAGLRLDDEFTFTSLRGDNPVFVDAPEDGLSARLILPPNAQQGDLVVNGVRAVYNETAGAFNALPLRTVPASPAASLYAGASACATAPVLASTSSFWDLPPVEGGAERFYKVTVAGPATKLRVAAQPSPSNAALRVQLVDPATCSVLIDPASEAALLEGTRTATTAAAVAPGTYGVRVSTGTVTLPNGHASPLLEAVRIGLSEAP
jgi:hypothetical protein